MINNGRGREALVGDYTLAEMELIRETDFLGYIIADTAGEEYADEKEYRKAIIDRIGTPEQQAFYAILLLRAWVHVNIDLLGEADNCIEEVYRLEMMEDIVKATKIIYTLGGRYHMQGREFREALDLSKANMALATADVNLV